MDNQTEGERDGDLIDLVAKKKLHLHSTPRDSWAKSASLQTAVRRQRHLCHRSFSFFLALSPLLFSLTFSFAPTLAHHPHVSPLLFLLLLQPHYHPPPSSALSTSSLSLSLSLTLSESNTPSSQTHARQFGPPPILGGMHDRLVLGPLPLLSLSLCSCPRT